VLPGRAAAVAISKPANAIDECRARAAQHSLSK
jgi:hypothetical protein